MYEKTFYGVHPQMMAGASNEDLRERHWIGNLLRPGEIVLTYSHGERFVIGGAVPADTSLRLPDHTEPESDAGHPFLERREMGVVNVGNARGTVTVDGKEVALEKYQALYIPVGSIDVRFEGEGARYYLLSVPAHKRFTLRRLTLEGANPLKRGSLETSNARTIYQLILPGLCDSASLCLGLTILNPGSVWNTMPPHIHERRSEIYFYFDLADDARVFHYMGRPDNLRHIVMKNEEAVISPPWSVHMGAGTRAYAFIWAMAGENLDYSDINALDICQLQ